MPFRYPPIMFVGLSVQHWYNSLLQGFQTIKSKKIETILNSLSSLRNTKESGLGHCWTELLFLSHTFALFKIQRTTTGTSLRRSIGAVHGVRKMNRLRNFPLKTISPRIIIFPWLPFLTASTTVKTSPTWMDTMKKSIRRDNRKHFKDVTANASVAPGSDVLSFAYRSNVVAPRSRNYSGPDRANRSFPVLSYPFRLVDDCIQKEKASRHPIEITQPVIQKQTSSTFDIRERLKHCYY